MRIADELKNNKTVLVLVQSKDYNDMVASLAKDLSGKSVCYITLNKTFDALKESFKKKKVDTSGFIFVDAITKTFRKVPDSTDGCYYISSPAAMTEIAISIDRFVKHDFEYIIFDSLTNLLIYERKAPVAKFIANIVNKIGSSKTKAVFFALAVDEHEALIKEAGMFVDKVIEAGSAER